MTEELEELAQRYLAGTLTEEERSMAETKILTDPEFQDDVELTHSMRQGLRELARRGELAPLLAARRPSWFGSTFAFAASAAAIAFAATALMLYLRLDRVESAGYDGPSVHATLNFVLTRSAEPAPDVTWRRSATPTLVDLSFDVGLEPAGSYNVVVARDAQGPLIPLIAIPNAATDADGRVQLSIHSGILKSGDYRIRLTPRLGSGSAASWDYSMRVLD